MVSAEMEKKCNFWVPWNISNEIHQILCPKLLEKIYTIFKNRVQGCSTLYDTSNILIRALVKRLFRIIDFSHDSQYSVDEGRIGSVISTRLSIYMRASLSILSIYIRALSFSFDWWPNARVRQGLHRPSTALIYWLFSTMRKVWKS